MAPKIIRFGPVPGAAGVSVLEKTGSSALPDPRFGTIAMAGVLRRGPEDVWVPVNSRAAYDMLYGDPANSRWHLYPRAEHLMPDAVDGFFSNGGSDGMLWALRLGLDGSTRAAEKVIKNRMGTPVLKIEAANGGQWGGKGNFIAETPVTFATTRTFTVVAPDVKPNEFIGAKAVFSSVTGRQYEIQANTGAFDTGEAIFTVGAQYDLFADGVSGPVALSGIASYTLRTDLTGTIAFPLRNTVTGTVNINNTVVTGVGTAFSSEIAIGDTIYFEGEARTVLSVSSDTTLTIDAAFTTAVASGASIEIPNLVVAGTGTAFDTELAVGSVIYVEIDGDLEPRTVASIESAESLTLTSGFTATVTAGTLASTDNYKITGSVDPGSETAFLSDVIAGQFIIDPNRASHALKVVEVVSDSELIVEGQFTSDFIDMQLTKQTQRVELTLEGAIDEGLAVEIGQGQRYPQTHFSLIIYFNGSEVMRINDASLDPADSLYVENVVREANTGYSQGDADYPIWIKATNLWASEYTTNPGTDVRPANGSGQVLALTPTRIYTIAEFDYDRVIGRYLYPNPYFEQLGQPRNVFRVTQAKSPLVLDGQISSIGTTVSGVSTLFETQIATGDYIYDPNSNTARKVRVVTSDTELQLETAFPANVPADTESIRLGYVGVDRGYDLTRQTALNHYYLVQYPESLEKGYDGDLGSLIPWHYTQHFDVDRNTLENATWGRNLGLIRVAIPGVSDTVVQKAAVTYCEAKAYEFRGEIPSMYKNAASVEAFLKDQFGLSNMATLIFPTYVWISNPLGLGDRQISIVGDVMGGETRASAAADGYHVPFAGTAAKLNRIVRMPAALTSSDEAILGPAGIQQIIKEQGNWVVWDVMSPAIDDIFRMTHIRRIQSNMVRVFREAQTLRNLLFTPNNPETQEELRMVLANYLRREYQKGVINRLYAYKQVVFLQVGSNTGTAIANDASVDALVANVGGELAAEIRFVPAGVVRNINIGLGPQVLSVAVGSTVQTL